VALHCVTWYWAEVSVALSSASVGFLAVMPHPPARAARADSARG
jgi:hypothetical protein